MSAAPRNTDRDILTGYSSKAFACRHKAHKGTWAVLVRNGNYSAFNGYRFTPSAYSLIKCGACGALWRTSAGYVAELPDAKAGTA